MKITVTFLMFLALFLSSTPAQEYTQWRLPEGAKARLGQGSIREIRYSPDGARLAVATSIGLWLYDTAPYHEVALLTGTDMVRCAAFSPDGKVLTSGSGGYTVHEGDVMPEDNTVRLWDVVTGEHRQTLTEHTGSVNSVTFSPDGATLVSGSMDIFDTDTGSVQLWDADTSVHKRTVTEHKGSVMSLAFSPDGTMFTCGSDDRTIRLWDTATWAHKQTLTGHTAPVYSVAFSPDGRVLASGSNDKTIRLWDAVTGEHKQTLTGHTDTVNSVTFNPESGVLASGSEDGTVRLWKLTD